MAASFFFLGQTTAGAAFNGLPTQTPRRDLPRVTNGSVLDSTQVGDYIVVVGDFTQIQTRDGEVHHTSGAYAYDIDTGELIEAFLPTVRRNGGLAPSIRTVEAAGPDSVFLGGQFHTVNGLNRDRLVKISLRTGHVNTSFVANFNSVVNTVVYDGGRLFVGGDFTSVNGVARARLVQLNGTSGAVNPSFRFDITETSAIDSSFSYGPKYLSVTDDDVLVVAHRGRRVGGLLRPGLALIDLQAKRVMGYSTNFWGNGEIFMQDAEVSPDGTYVVVVSNGGDFPLEGKDAGVRFDITDRNTPNQSERWIARNFDSTYSVGISDSAIYMGGHFCWVEGPQSPTPFPGVGNYTNDNSCFGITSASRFAPATVNRDQIAAFDPATGLALNWDPGSDGYVGVLSIEVIDRGLLLGHDGTYLGRNGTERRAWNVGRHGFFDNSNPNGLSAGNPVAATSCWNQTATIVGTQGNDVLTGTDGVDVIVGLGGDDIIKGLGGNDIICGGNGRDTVYGGTGNDIILGGGLGDVLVGQAGIDQLVGGSGNDTLTGGSGADTLRGGTGNDKLFGAVGNDYLFGDSGIDVLTGWTGNDYLDGGSGKDTLRGSAGNDALRGAGGNDLLYGAAGNDNLQGDNGIDLLHGGAGLDRCAGTTFGAAEGPGDTRPFCERQ